MSSRPGDGNLIGDAGQWPGWCRAFCVDLRSLAVLRIGLGILLLLDLWVRSGDLMAHYTDLGLLPRSAWQAPAGRWSVYLVHGSPWFAGIMFSVAAVAAVLLILGVRTRLMTMLSWVLLLSLQNRHPLLNNSGDSLFLLILFWSMFLPLGAVGSIDALRSTARPAWAWLSTGGIGLVVQIMAVYIVTAILKDHHIWRVEHSAVYRALSIDEFRKPLGDWLLEYPRLMAVQTAVTQWLELLGPLLLLLGWRARVLAVSLFMALHVGFVVTMELGLFSYVCMLAWLAMLPGQVWDWLGRFEWPTRLADVWQRLLGRISRVLTTLRLTGSTSVDAPHTMAGELMAAWALALVLLINLGAIKPGLANHEPIRIIAQATRLSQSWRMFLRPNPHSGWYVVKAQTADGRLVDLWTGEALTWQRPERIEQTYASQRWRKYMMNIRRDRHADHRAHLVRWLVDQSDEPIVAASLIFNQYTTSRPGEPRLQEKRVLYEWQADNDAQSVPRPMADDADVVAGDGIEPSA